MNGYDAREVARMLGRSEKWVQGFVRDGLVQPARDAEGRMRFGFRDLVLLRTARRLLAQDASPRRVRRALAALRDRLPAGVPLSGVRLGMEGGELVVSGPTGRWAPESGQAMFEFDAPPAAPISAIESASSFSADRAYDDGDLPEISVLPIPPPADGLDPDAAPEMGCADWMDLAEAYEREGRPLPARDALRRALEVDPFETEARARLARHLEADGRLESAERHLDLARRHRPRDPDLAVDHGRILLQLGRDRAALEAFEAAIAEDPELAEAYLGAADAHERLGNLDASREVLRASEHLRGDRD